MPVEERHVGFVIGSKGSTVKMIKKKTGAWIQIQQGTRGGTVAPYFEIKGQTQRQVDEAIRWISELCEEAQNRLDGISTNITKQVPPKPSLYESAFPALGKAAMDEPEYYDEDYEQMMRDIQETMPEWYQEQALPGVPAWTDEEMDANTSFLEEMEENSLMMDDLEVFLDHIDRGEEGQEMNPYFIPQPFAAPMSVHPYVVHYPGVYYDPSSPCGGVYGSPFPPVPIA